MITYAFGQETDIPMLKELWQEVFGDSMTYIDFFFAHCYPHCRSVVAKDGDKVVAMLYLLPSTFCHNGKEETAMYIYAVGTAVDYRNNGISGQLLLFTHSKLRKEGVRLSYLTPASSSLFSFYTRNGFTTYFGMVEKSLPTKTGEHHLVSVPMEELWCRYKSLVTQFPVAIRWGQELYGYMGKELLFGGGQAYALENGKAFAICYKTPKGCAIKEILGESEADKKALLGELSMALTGEVTYRVAGNTPLSMVYWYSEPIVCPLENSYVGLVLDE